MRMTVPVSTSSDAGALWIRLARPDKLNALSLAMADTIGTLLEEAEADNAIRVVVLTGSGRAFSAGADIDDISRVLADPEVAVREFVARGHRLTTRIEQFPKPVIAAVNGLAYGGGCELVEACHLAIAASTATFAKPEIRLGFPPSWGGTQRLPRLVGRKRALAMILTAETIDANTAATIGLVNEVVADEELVPAVRRWIDRILPHGSAAVAACLTAVTRGAELPIDQALSVEASQFLRVAGRRDTVEAVQRFRIR